jgi:hypothetical protein
MARFARKAAMIALVPPDADMPGRN